MRVSLTLAAAGAAALSAAGASAIAATGHPSAPKSACAKVNGPSRVGRISGIIRAVPVKAACQTSHASDPANGSPPLWFHGGNVMGTRSTGAVVVTPIFWDPPGHGMALAYKKILKTYLGGVAAASGQHTNVFSTLNGYFGTNGQIHYKLKLGTPINDSDALPASACTVASTDHTAIYADNSGYNACLDDAQVIAETNSVIGANHLPINLSHIYVMYLPKHVEACFLPGSTTTNANQCTINHQPSAAFCAYHSMAPSGAVYANLAFPIYHSPVGFTCGSDARFPVVQTPNGNADADTEVSPTSHEIMEAITDPDTNTGWYDSVGFENGDECAYVFGTTHGATGARYNQVIGGHRYLTQEEFSNRDFLKTGGGCLPAE
ncbi:MAG: hypothetical protein ACR2FU_21905 [Streptosporangiaceae bacterium]